MIGIGWSVESSINSQDGENGSQRRSPLGHILNGDPAASLTRRRAQTWCSLFVAPCAPEGTPAVWPSAAALLDERSDQPAGIPFEQWTPQLFSSKRPLKIVVQQGPRRIKTGGVPSGVR